MVELAVVLTVAVAVALAVELAVVLTAEVGDFSDFSVMSSVPPFIMRLTVNI